MPKNENDVQFKISLLKSHYSKESGRTISPLSATNKICIRSFFWKESNAPKICSGHWFATFATTTQKFDVKISFLRSCVNWFKYGIFLTLSGNRTMETENGIILKTYIETCFKTETDPERKMDYE